MTFSGVNRLDSILHPGGEERNGVAGHVASMRLRAKPLTDPLIVALLLNELILDTASNIPAICLRSCAPVFPALTPKIEWNARPAPGAAPLPR